MLFGFPHGSIRVLLGLLVLWTVFWKGIALWKASRRDQLVWYIVLLVLSTAGLLDIIYIYAVAPNQPDLVSEGPPAA